ncbi:hypothetical protein OIU85_027431 [Salix viminalis]|uniref:Uncharacterized protein n=1 Tax=Salix viminalis TaxID=40686 RepID=A0A9Q0QI31_SALVM|nr:hypothetical protein OIU85_027431 [Salix viminalis]
MEKDKQSDISSAQAVLLGALAPGVNGPTWNTLKSAFLLLGLCLAMMLVLAFSSSDSSMVIHVGFLVTITATLFLLLSCLLCVIISVGLGLWKHSFCCAMYLISPLSILPKNNSWLANLNIPNISQSSIGFEEMVLAMALGFYDLCSIVFASNNPYGVK